MVKPVDVDVDLESYIHAVNDVLIARVGHTHIYAEYMGLVNLKKKDFLFYKIECNR